MVYVTFFWVRSVKLPFHCVRLAAGALGASSIWFGPALNIGLASRMSGYLVSWAKAILAHARIRAAAITLTAKGLFILSPALERFDKTRLPTGERGRRAGRYRTIGLAGILVERQQQVKTIAEIVRLILQRDHDSITTAESCNF